MPFQILFTSEAMDTLRSIRDRRIRSEIIQRIEKLTDEPDKQGKPLLGDLAGYRSIRAVGQRYRVVYSIDWDQARVVVIAAGIRRDGDGRDIYGLAQRLIRLGLVEPTE